MTDQSATLDLDALERAARAAAEEHEDWADAAKDQRAFQAQAAPDAILNFIAAHRALQERVEGDEWRPIETAPRDGTDVFLWRGYSPPVIAGWFSSEGHSGDWYTFDAPHSAVSGLVTHWRPLPEPPARTKAGEPHEQE